MKSSVLLCLFFVFNLLSAQDNIQYIRSVYQEVSQQIEACSDPDECSLYKNEIIINKDQSAWRAVGNYHKTITFWYTDDPVNCDDCLDMGKGVLSKVIVEEIAGVYPYYYEYLYQEGQLLFHYYKDESEYRLYFDKGELLRYMEGQTVSEDRSDRRSVVLSEANHYMELFLMSF